MTSGRFSVWNERQIAMGMQKYWGSIESGVSGNFHVSLKGTNFNYFS